MSWMRNASPSAGSSTPSPTATTRWGVDFFQPIAEGLVARLDPQPGERALDLGCGRRL
jgi:hypothetical protein